MTEYKKQIITVLDDRKAVLGFAARYSTIYGDPPQEAGNPWFATRTLSSSKWNGPFANRKDLSAHLKVQQLKI